MRSENAVDGRIKNSEISTSSMLKQTDDETKTKYPCLSEVYTDSKGNASAYSIYIVCKVKGIYFVCVSVQVRVALSDGYTAFLRFFLVFLSVFSSSCIAAYVSSRKFLGTAVSYIICNLVEDTHTPTHTQSLHFSLLLLPPPQHTQNRKSTLLSFVVAVVAVIVVVIQ